MIYFTTFLSRNYILHNIILGTLRGCAAIICRDVPAPYFLIVLIILPLFGAITAVGMVPGIFYSWSLPQIVILVLTLLYSGIFTPLVAIIFSIGLIGGIYFFYKNYHQMFLNMTNYRNKSESLLQQLQSEHEKVEALSEEKSRFLATASHELRQPLHAITLLLEAADTRQPENLNDEYFSKLKRAAGGVNQLVDDLLDLSRLESGLVKPHIREFPVNELFSELQQELSYPAEAKKLTLLWHRSNYIIKSDYVLLQRILRNLIINAIKYTDEGAILIGCRFHNDKIAVHVIDTGPGISEKDQAIIFQEYQRNHYDTHKEQGLGLGLSIVKKLSGLLDADMGVHSNVGKGSDFYISVTRVQGRPTRTERSRFDTASVLSGRNIMIIDDDAEVCGAMGTLLEKWGAKATLFTCLEQAVSEYHSTGKKADIILADFNLGSELNGIEAIQALQKLYQYSTPAALITADVETAAKYMKQNFRAPIMAKPVQPAKLRSMLQHLCE